MCSHKNSHDYFIQYQAFKDFLNLTVDCVSQSSPVGPLYQNLLGCLLIKI